MVNKRYIFFSIFILFYVLNSIYGLSSISNQYDINQTLGLNLTSVMKGRAYENGAGVDIDTKLIEALYSDEKEDVYVGIQLKDNSNLSYEGAASEGERWKIYLKQREYFKNLTQETINDFRKKELEFNVTRVGGPNLFGYITKKGLEKISKDPRINFIAIPGGGTVALQESLPLINASLVWGLGYSGKNKTICVIDSGVNKSHPALQNKVLNETCYCGYRQNENTSCCPSGSSVQFGNNSALDNSGHGTYVAGIISAKGGINGTAPDSKIIAIKIANSSGAWKDEDLRDAVDWCILHKVDYNISIISISLATEPPAIYNNVADCENLRYAADYINIAKINGIFVVAASGNDNSMNKISYPACVSGATSVGAVYDANVGWRSWLGVCSDSFSEPDKIVCLTNRGNLLDLLAPGCRINSTNINGGYGWGANDCGTSFAAPHVAGVAALLLEKNATLTPNDIEKVLKDKGISITDSCSNCSGLTFKRIDVLSAINYVCGCTAWQYQGCGGGSGGGGCGTSEGRFTRSCNGTSCTGAEGEWCVYNSSCVGGGGGTTRYVCKSGCNYSTVQSALNAASNNDLIIINDSATYNENVAWPLRDGITLNCKGATLSGSSGKGINLSNRDDNTIEYCNIMGYGYGIFLDDGAGLNKIKYNNISQNVKGVYLEDNAQPSNYIIYNNISLSTDKGIFFWGAIPSDSPHYNFIEDNILEDNKNYGIYFYYGMENDILRNIFENNSYSIYNRMDTNNGFTDISHNIFKKSNYGSYFFESDTNTLSNNSFCPANVDYDIYLDNSMSNVGTDNTCEKPDGWNDTGVIGCTYLCNYPPNTTLVAPSNATLSYDGNITFTCAAYDPENYNLSNITLYHNIGGTWQANQTNNLSGITDSATFTVNNIKNGTYQWNCKAYDQDFYNSVPKSDWGDANYSFTVYTASLFVMSEINDLYTNRFEKIFEFKIKNGRNSSLNNINWSFDFGDGNKTYAQNLVNLSSNEEIFVYLHYNYSSAQAYNVNATVFTENKMDSKTKSISFNVQVVNLSVLNSSFRKRIFEFILNNPISSNLSNVYWNMTLGGGNSTNSTQVIILQPNEKIFVFAEHNYTSNGTFQVNATARNGTLIDSKNISVSVI